MIREPVIRIKARLKNANRVINGVCRAMWLSLENLLQEKLPSDNILIAWLIPHAAWCLTRFQVKSDENCVVRFLESVHEPSVVIQKWGHGTWVGNAPMTVSF